MRITVLRALGLGDLLASVPALRGLRAAHPEARTALVGPAGLAGLLPPGLVDEVHDLSLVRAIDDGCRLPGELAGPDLAVNLHGRGPQSTAMLSALAPSRLVSYGVSSRWRDDEHEVHRWCRLLAEAGIPADPARLEIPAPEAPPDLRDAVIVHAGASVPSRRWPADRWAVVARALRRRGERVLLTGGRDERPEVLSLAGAAGVPERDVLAGRTTPRELAAVIGSARLLLSPDTGVAHLATALGTPSVVLFGPTSPALWGPPPDRAEHRVLWSGRTGDNAADRPDPGLLAITPGDVLDAAGDLLALGRRDGAGRLTVDR